MNRQFLMYAGLIALLVSSNGAVFYFSKKQVPIIAYQREMAFSLDEMVNTKGPFVVVLGDSLTQYARLPATVCDIPLISAGFGGLRASGMIPFAEEMSALKILPTLIVVAIGVNDTLKQYNTDFHETYLALIDSLPKAPTALVTLPQIDPKSYKTPLNPDRSFLVNSAIRKLAEAKGFTLIDLSEIPNSSTVDGIHPIGYEQRNGVILGEIARVLKCQKAGSH